MKNLIRIDIGGTKCAVLSGRLHDDGNLEVAGKLGFITADHPSPGKMLPQLQSGIEEILKKQKLSPQDISAIGISCGGPLNSKTGVVLSPPNLPGWDEVHIVNFFEDKFSIPAALQNDANACALAEWKFGAGRGTRNMVFLTFGTGLGAGLIIEGKLYTGTNDNAGEVGHIRLEEFGPVGYGKTHAVDAVGKSLGLVVRKI